MPKTLVTGGAGFIGSHVARALAERGDELRLTVRESTKQDNLAGLEHETVKCDLLDRRQVRRALKDVDRVFHCAGMTSLRSSDAERLFEVNVIATRNLLEECLRAEVGRVVYTSSVAAIGPAEPGGRADESQLFTAGKLGIPYVNSKHEAEVEALRLAAKGLPLVCVNPCVVFGAGDVYGSSTSIVRRFMLGRIPAYVDGGLNIVDVDDVARGHVLADERGAVGERYILGNRNYTLDRLFADLGRVSGRRAARAEAPAGDRAAARAGARGRAGPPADHRRRGQVGRPVVDLQDDEGEARARLDDVPARGHDRGDRQLVHRPRGRPLQALAALAADPVQARRGDARHRREGPDS